MNDSLGSFCAFIYVALWLITFVVYWNRNRRRRVGLGTFVIFLNLLVAFSAYLLYNSPNMGWVFYDLTLFPFIYLYVLLLIAASPLFRYSSNERLAIVPPNSFILNAIVLVLVLSTFIRLPSLIREAPRGIVLLLSNSDAASELYEEMSMGSSNAGYGGINLPVLLMNAFSTIGILLFCYYLTLDCFNKYLFAGLAFSVIIAIIEPLLVGSRTAPVLNLLTLLATILALRHHIPKFRLRLLSILGVSFLSLFFLLILSLTIGRFSSSVSADKAVYESVVSYTGQGPLYFNNYGLDAHGTRNGDRVLLLPKKFLGYDVPNNFRERRQKYSTMLLDDSHFSTFVGDLALDFGPFLTAILIIFISLFAFYKMRPYRGKFYFHQLLVMYFVLTICVQGAMYLYPYGDIGGNLKLLVLIAAYLAFRFTDSRQRVIISKND